MDTIKPLAERQRLIIYVAPRKRQKRDIDRYAVELGYLAINWNNLHEHLAQIFEASFPSTKKNDRLALAVWHSVNSDLAQRKMLRAIADRAQHLGVASKEEIIWLLNKADSFADRRNDAIHSPFIPANATTYWALVPDMMSFSPRARKLNNKDLLKEFKWYADSVRTLSAHAYRIARSLETAKPLPERPSLPILGQRRSISPKVRKSAGR
jgi:hypothetical protein